MADKKINIGLGFNVDKTNLNTLKTELQSLLNMSTDDLIKIGSENAVADLKEIQTAASAVQSALEKSFNPKLNTQDLTKFQQELKTSGQTISSIKAGLDKAGPSGQNAFRNITAELLTTNRQLKQSNEWLDKMAETMSNTVRWTIASGALNAVTGSIQKAYGFTKQLDTSLNDIRIVTGKSADEMARFAKEATTAAKNLGSTTTAYTKAALIYEQQGLGEADVAARTDVTTKVSNVTGQSAADVSEQLTAIWNGYKVSAAEAELYIDKVSAVAATTAADLEELSEGMGKVASAANSMGVDIDQLNASLATIISVTRQDASAVGTSLKTIYARMGDLAVDGEDEFGVKLGDVSGKLKTMGVDILDAQGQMREMGEVIEEVAAKWDTWTSAQQQAAAVALAGKRQYNNLIALFENWDMYEEAKSTSKGGAGELQKQQDIYMESMEAHLNQLQAEAEELYQTLLDPEGLNPLIDALTGVVGLVENLIESLGGGAGLLRTVGAIGFNVFGKQITKGITGTIHNITGFRDNLKQAASEAQLIKELDAEGLSDKRQQELLAIAKKRLEVADSISEAEHNAINYFIKQTNELYKQEDALEKNKKQITETAKVHLQVQASFDEKTGKLLNGEELKEEFQKQLKGGFKTSTDTTLKAQHIMEEEIAMAETVEAKKRSVSSYKGIGTKLDKQLMSVSEQAEKDSFDPELVQADNEAADKIREKQKTNAQDLQRANKALRESEEALKKKTQERQEVITDLLVTIEDEINNQDYSTDQKKELLAIQKALTKAYNADGTAKTNEKKLLEEAAAATKEYNVIIKDHKGQIDEAVEAIEHYNDELDTNNKNLEANKENQKKLFKDLDLDKIVGDVTDLAGGIANIVSGFQTLGNLGNVWGDENLTAGEKLLQTFSALGFAIPQIISGYSNLKKAWPGVVDGFKKMGKAAWASLGPYLPIVIAVVAALGALTAAILIGVKAWNKEAEAAKKAAEAAKALGDEYKQTKAAYEELKQSISDYQEARDALEDMTKGTQEWYDAVDQLNQKVLELMQTYPELAQYIKANDEGILAISEEGIRVLQEQRKNAVQSAYRLSLGAEIYKNTAQQTSDLTDARRQFGSYITTAKQATISKSYQTPISGSSTDVVASFTNDQLETVLKTVGKDSSLLGDEAKFRQVFLDIFKDSNLVSALWENQEALVKLSNTFNTTQASLKVLSQQYIDSALQSNVAYNNSEYKAQITNLLSKQLLEQADRLYEDKYKDASGHLTDKAAQTQYVAYMNATGQWRDGKLVKNKGGNIGVYSYTASDGTTKEVELDDATIRYALAQNEATGTLTTEDFSKINNYLANLTSGTYGKLNVDENKYRIDEAYANRVDASTKRINEQLANAASGLAINLTALTKKEIKIFNEQLKNLEQNEVILKEYTGLAIEDITGENGLAANALHNLANRSINAGNVIDDTQLREQFNNIFNNPQFWDDIAVEGKENFAKVINSIATLKDGSAEKLTNIFEDLIVKNYKGANELINTLDDFSSLEGLEEYADALFEDQELINAIGKEGIQEIIDSYTLGLNLWEARSVEAIQKSAASFAKILESVKRQGDIISAEDYETLGKEAQRYFTLMGDGTYMLTGAAGDFLATAKAARLESFKKDLAAIRTSTITAKNDNAKIEIDKLKENKATYEGQLQEIGTIGNVDKYLTDDYFAVGTDASAAIFAAGNGPRGTNELVNLSTEEKAKLKILRDKLGNHAKLIAEQDWGLWNKLFNGGGVNGSSAVWDVDDNNSIYYGNLKSLYDGIKLLQTWSNKGSEIQGKLDTVNSEISTYDNNQAIIDSANNKELELLDAAVRAAGSKNEAQALAKQYATEIGNTDPSAWAEDYLNSSKFNGLWSNVAADSTDIDDIDKQYEIIERNINKLNGELSVLQAQEEELYGEKLLTNLQQQLDIQRDIANEKENELNAARALQDLPSIEIDNQLSNINALTGSQVEDIAFTTDANGYITNRDAIETTLNNALVGLTADSRAAAETARDFILNAIDEHNTSLYDLITSAFNAEQAAIDAALKLLDTKFKEAHERNEFSKSYNDFMKEFAVEEDDYFKQLKYDIDSYAIAFDDAGQSMSKIEELTRATVDESGKGYVINGEVLTLEQLRAAVLEEGANLQEYALSLKESLTNLQELEMIQLEEIAEQYDNIVGYAESWNEFLEHGLALQELIHGENYEATKSWYEAQVTAVQSQLDTQKSEYAYWKNIVAEIEAGTHSNYTYDEARAKMLESGKEVAATSAELGQVLYDNFERAWNSHFEGFERAKSEYEWISSQAERAFDTITGALESQKLINDWTKTMNETLDESAQKRMKEFIDLQEEKLKNLRTEGKLSQYNLDLAQAEFDLLQAQIALEDARNNKTQMRLTRGADGSYSYQYVANDQAIAQAEGQVAEAAKNRLDIVKKEMDSQVNNFYDDVTDLQNLLLEYAPDGISPEEEAELNKRVTAMKSNLFDANGNVRLEADLREAVESAAAAAGIEGYENLSLEELVEKFPEFKGYLDIINAIKEGKLETILENGIGSVGDLMDYLGSLATTVGGSPSGEDGTLMGEIKDLLAGLTADELADLGESIDGLEKISKAADAAKDSFNTFAESIGSVITQLTNLGTATSGSEWSSILFGENGEGGLSGAIATAIGGAQTLSEETIKAIQEGTSVGIQNYLTEYTPTANQGNTTSTTTNETTNNYDVNVYIPTAATKEEVLEVLDEVFNNTEQAIHDNGRGGSFKVTVSNK